MALAEVNAALCAIGAPYTVKLLSRIDSNTALTVGVQRKSCAQARRARSGNRSSLGAEIVDPGDKLGL
jgi:hypothetical protein